MSVEGDERGRGIGGIAGVRFLVVDFCARENEILRSDAKEMCKLRPCKVHECRGVVLVCGNLRRGVRRERGVIGIDQICIAFYVGALIFYGSGVCFKEKKWSCKVWRWESIEVMNNSMFSGKFKESVLIG